MHALSPLRVSAGQMSATAEPVHIDASEVGGEPVAAERHAAEPRLEEADRLVAMGVTLVLMVLATTLPNLM